jgi:hypothetical protein
MARMLESNPGIRKPLPSDFPLPGEAFMAGYSSTPLVKKLGVRPGARAHFVNAPGSFEDTLGPLPDGARLLRRPSAPLDFILLFVDREADLVAALARLQPTLARDGMVWVAWPKKASRVPTDLTEDVVRRVALDAGLVDVKVCAIDDTWSGLKLVYRLADR